MKYTCVTVSQSTTSIITDVTVGGVKSYLLKDSSGTINSLTFEWKNTDETVPVFSPCDTTNGSQGCFKPQVNWTSLGLLRFRLIPAYVVRGDSSIIDVVAFPGTSIPVSSNTVDFSVVSTSKQQLIFANCSVISCSVIVKGLPSSSYYVQIYGYYRPMKLTINGTTTVGGVSQSTVFNGAQATIDSTGAAGDVLKRVRVTVPVGSISVQSNFDNLPPFSLGVGDKLCKRFKPNTSGTSDLGKIDTPSCPSF